MIQSVFEIADETVRPGTKKVILFPAPNLNNQAIINIPVHVFHGKKPGPRLFILSGIHGDELNGVEIIRRLHKHIHPLHLSGTLLTLPMVNIHGLMAQKRYFSDRRDLNRTFPGKQNGTLAARFAYGIMHHIVKGSDYGIDLHTGAVGNTNMPQIRVDFNVTGAKKFAQNFAAPIILEAKTPAGSLRESASKLGIPVLVYEGGEALRYSELCIREGVKGILHAMKYLKMIDFVEKHPPRKTIIAHTSRWLRAPASGLVQPVAEVFTKKVKKGQLLAHIHDPFLINPTVDVIAPFEGIVVGQAMKAMATEGDALYHIASSKKMAGYKPYIDEYRDTISL